MSTASRRGAVVAATLLSGTQPWIHQQDRPAGWAPMRMRPMRRTAKQDSAAVSRLIVIVAVLVMAAVFVLIVVS